MTALPSARAGGEIPDRRLVEFRALVDQLAAHDQALRADATDQALVPVTVVTGPLGSGKTTLVRQLLQADHGMRLSVIVNDLAAVNIDAELLSDASDDRVELTNGCTCCSLVGEMTSAVQELAADAPDAILVETSGVSDPVAVCQAIDELTCCRLDGVITVVDAERVAEILDHPLLADSLERQLGAATVITLTKPDLVSASMLTAIRTRLAELAPGRPFVTVLEGALDPAIALDGTRHGVALAGTGTSSTDTGHGVVTREVEASAAWSLTGLGAWLDDPDRPELLRAKGSLVMNDGARHLLQLVGRRWRLEPRTSGADAQDQIVLIGLDRTEVDAAAAELERGPLDPKFQP